MSKSITIAIDGYSSTGKGTLARALANRLSYRYIDTGAMYRAATWIGMQDRLVSGDEVDRKALLEKLDHVDLEFRHNPKSGKSEIYIDGIHRESEIRTPEVTASVSAVSAIPEVRRKMVDIQRNWGREGGIVMEGRDIGTVVFPDAELKIFMTAEPEIRAQRRYDEWKKQGLEIEFEDVLTDLNERDHKDSNREDSPLKQAPDARLLDNSKLNPEEQLDLAYRWVQEIIGL